MRNLIPRFITDQMRDGRFSGELPAAGLFIDMSGFTRMTDELMTHGQAGSEALAVIMRRVFDPLIEHVEAQGGFVAVFEGDAFQALFPAHADDLVGAARRALDAAWQMQQWMSAHPYQETPYGQFEISAKIGLALGMTEWAILTARTDDRALYYFRGPAIAEAAAAQGLAGRGEIILQGMICEALIAEIAADAISDRATMYRLTEVLAAPAATHAPPPQAPVDALIARFVPKEVAAYPVSGEFRHAVSVFIRFAQEPEAAGIESLIDKAFELQDRYGGMLNRLSFGDKGTNLLLFWGAPTSHENDIERALSYALDLRAEAGLEFSAGITYRIAHAGFVGGERREDYTCYSRGVNLAARLMMAAPMGAIWLDAPAAERARDTFELAEIGALSFKGFENRQTVYALSGRRHNPQRRFDGDLVGRQADLARLFVFAQSLRAGLSPGLLVVWGEAGIGKSHLLDEFIREADGPAANHWLVALCQADQTLRQSLNPFRYWLRRYFDQSAPVAEHNRRAFEQRLDNLIAAVAALAGDNSVLAAELHRTRSFLGALVDLYEPGSLYDRLDAQGRFENTLQALIALLQAESLRQPVILYLEDAHWMDEDSRDFVGGLARMLSTEDGRAYPIAVIATARPDPGNELFAESVPHEQLRLAGLSGADLAELAAEVLGGPIAPDLLAFLNTRAEGNPFFADQLVHYLQDHDALVSGPGGWDLLRRVIEAAPVPDGVQALLVARLDRLTAEVRSVVQTAAVLGREFEVRVLSAMLRGDQRLLSAVEAAERAAIWSALDALRYLFQHALLRDAAYDMQIRSRLATLHALAASGLHEVYAHDLAPHYADLAYHYGRAGDLTGERRYSRLAGERAVSQYANVEAERLLARALALTPEDELMTRFELLSSLERVHDLQGQRASQQADLAGLAAVGDALGDRQLSAEAALRAANYARVTGDLASASVQVERAVSYADGVLSARALALRARILLHAGEYAEALRWLEEAHARALRVGDRSLTAQALYDTGIGYYYQDRFSEAAAYFGEAQPIYRELGDRRGEINALLMFGTISSRQGDHDAGRERLNEALALCHEIGWRHGEAYVLGNLANSYFELGDYATTQRLHEHALALARAIGDQEGEAASLSTLALVVHRLGEPTRALELYRQAIAIQSGIGDLRGEGYTLTGMGHALADLGDLDAAEGAFGKALEIRRRLDPETPLAVDDLVGLAMVALRRGDTGRAAAFADAAVAWMDERGVDGIEFPVQAWLVCYRAYAANAGEDRSRHERARMALARGNALLQEQAAAIKDDQLRRAFLDAAPFHRELLEEWRRLGG